MKTRLQRQVAIRNIIVQNKVTSQEELLMLLKRKGFGLTQATLSRDIKSLKIVKTPDTHGGYIYVLSKEEAAITRPKEVPGASYLADGFVSIDFSGNMAVIKTRPAYASSFAAVIDSASPFEILGTIAGDDTIFLVLREGVEKGDMIEFLEIIMPNLKGKLI
ncbi:MAG TPA: ArgR family transcriptional regulator [Prolixibacteraceae bacterium]|nr:ArgR family transcriptional regulator [Prolixibacteraceae bacterium]HPS13237.1 ArgR family transcriptional regulator [Prolixibacteraceae bacterium]